MLESGTKIDWGSILLVSKVSAQFGHVKFFLGLHGQVVKVGLNLDVFVVNSILRGYCVFGFVHFAHTQFDVSTHKDLVAWTVLINGYVRNGHPRLAIDLFFEMWEKERRVDEFLGVALFNSCAQLEDLSSGRRLEDLVRESGIEFDSYMNNALIDMYCKCGSIVDAQRHFDDLVGKDVVAWNSMITGYGRVGNMEAAKALFRQMP
ncbi:Pentatricopeptide repeat [Dillenia turbinata]|uniref:Pentatricopeptide repeat n=1 Tax=Dillenia turbinata TaxID=194707 RepID=A0AAN8V8J6_9MAGN